MKLAILEGIPVLTWTILETKEKGTTFSFHKALDNAINFHKKSKKKLPVIVVSSNSSYEHQILSFVVPMPLELFKKAN